jgi:DNA-binding transcriptional MerR regulator
VTVKQFAARAGVSVRALHHYDRLGLLRPARSNSGYRVYREQDLGRLEQIVTLRFLGLPLRDIPGLLNRTENLAGALRRQRRALEDKRRELTRAIDAIAEAERLLAAGRKPDPELYQTIIEVITMQENKNWTDKYYTESARAKVEARRHLWSPELQARVEREWADLARDVEANVDADPAGPVSHELVSRYRKLIDGFTGGDPEIQAGLNKMWSERENLPQKFEGPWDNPAFQKFIQRGMAAQSRKS